MKYTLEMEETFERSFIISERLYCPHLERSVTPLTINNFDLILLHFSQYIYIYISWITNTIGFFL